MSAGRLEESQSGEAEKRDITHLRAEWGEEDCDVLLPTGGSMSEKLYVE
jgi:hypothetical protein